MKIALIVEGKTETAFLPFLRNYLEGHLAGEMPRLDPTPYHGRIPTDGKLRRLVTNLLQDQDHVIALTDVYTGSKPPEFTSAEDAKQKMRRWVGIESRFHAHVALHDFEAWLLPYWPEIQRRAGSNRKVPAPNPETVNHDNPPAHRLQEIFRTGKKGKSYVKPRDAGRILRDANLSIAIEQCPELKSLINTILTICGSKPVA